MKARQQGLSIRRAAAAALGLVLALAAGCSTVDDPLLVGAVPPTPGGAYPNLNLPVHGATTQLTDAERDAKLAALAAAAQRQGPPGSAGDEARKKRLKLLPGQQDDTLEVIEND